MDLSASAIIYNRVHRLPNPISEVLHLMGLCVSAGLRCAVILKQATLLAAVMQQG